MRILAVTVEYPPRVGGIASHVAELRKAMLAIGCDYQVVAPFAWRPGAEPPVEDPAGILRPTVISARPLYDWMLRRSLRRLLAGGGFDAIHVHGLRPLPACSRLGLPLVFTNHSSGFLARLERGPRESSRIGHRLAAADAIIAPSRELAEATRAVGYAGPIEVIPNGVDPERFSPTGHSARPSWGIAEDEVVFLLPRRLVEKNGVVWFAHALARLGSGRWRAVIAGAGPEEQEMRRVLAEGGVLDRCLFLGAVPQDRMPEVHRGADVIVLPSLREATSIAGLEAMAAGRPVVGTSVGGIPEIVQEGVTGLLVPPENPEALASALWIMTINGNLRKSYGDAARLRVEREFSWTVIAKRTLDVLGGQVVGERNGPTGAIRPSPWGMPIRNGSPP